MHPLKGEIFLKIEHYIEFFKRLTMNRFTLKELRELATKHKIPNRSKYKKKAELYEFLKATLGEDLGYNSSITLPLSLERVKKETEKPPKPSLSIITKYDYVVIQSKSTKSLFPQINEKHQVNENVNYIYGYERFEAVWVINGTNSEPVGFKGSYNAPFTTKFLLEDGRTVDFQNLYFDDLEEKEIEEKEANENDVIIYDEKSVEGIWLIPSVSPDMVGYRHLLEKYGKKKEISENSEFGEYYIAEFIEFEGELCDMMPKLNYRPDFVIDIEQTLEGKGLPVNECLIYQNVESRHLKELKEYLLDAKYDEITKFGQPKYIQTDRLGHQIAYLQAS